ncbi:hypothetical protein KCP73_17505 [Salmonella enterica subsp. enterica]|nr:hypothetical protein KCP73_17505 [Salmonella enterica subsp. enterica]
MYVAAAGDHSLVLFAIALNHTSLIVTGLKQQGKCFTVLTCRMMIFGGYINNDADFLLCFCAVWFRVVLYAYLKNFIFPLSPRRAEPVLRRGTALTFASKGRGAGYASA